MSMLGPPVLSTLYPEVLEEDVGGAGRDGQGPTAQFKGEVPACLFTHQFTHYKQVIARPS